MIARWPKHWDEFSLGSGGCDGVLLRGLLVNILGVSSFKLSIVDNLDYSIYLRVNTN